MPEHVNHQLDLRVQHYSLFSFNDCKDRKNRETFRTEDLKTIGKICEIVCIRKRKFRMTKKGLPTQPRQPAVPGQQKQKNPPTQSEKIMKQFVDIFVRGRRRWNVYNFSVSTK